MADKKKNHRGKSQEKLMDVTGLTSGVSQLINKYAGGRIPILVDDIDARQGLVNGELVRIYQAGFGIENLIPLGILYAKIACKDNSSKWKKENADYHLNEWSRPYWTRVCKTIRSDERGNKECEDCDRRHAELAEKKGDVIAYMCVYGMVDFAMPIFVEDQVIAVIFTAQRVPQINSRWNKEFIEDGVFSLKECDESGVDAKQVTLERFKDADEKYDLGTGALVGKLEEDVKESEGIEVTPADVETLRKKLKEAGQHLSQLADSTYRLEKGKTVAALRSSIAQSVADVDVDVERVAETLPSVVEGISKAAGLICKYFGIDYMLVLNIKEEKTSFRILLEHTPEQIPWKRGVWAEELDDENFPKLKEELSRLPRFDDADLWPLRKLPFFNWIATWLKGKQASRCVAARLVRPGLSPCVLLAGRKTGLRLSDFRQQDRDDFSRIIGDINMVMNVLLSIDELRATGEAQNAFLEDIAHDIRNPIQNLLIKTEHLKSGLIQPNEVLDETRRLGAQIRQLHHLSQRLWVLERLQRGDFELDKGKLVGVYQVIMEVVSTIEDLAKDKHLTIGVAWNIKEWRAIKIDHDLFFQALLNLIDNAIKYSSRGTEIRIDGDMKLYTKCRISVVNRGIEIKKQYRDKIFKRGFRTPEAKMHIWQGSGIGLCIVKAFADFYNGGIEVKCSRVLGDFDFVTEFRLTFAGAIL